MESIKSPSYWLSVLALLVSLVTAVFQFWGDIFPSSKTVLAISNVRWEIGDGRLGRGPYPIITANFSNQGNSPFTISGMDVLYFENSDDKVVADCRSTEQHRSVGVPWDFVFRGNELEEPYAIPIQPGFAISEYVVFESFRIKDLSTFVDGEYFKIFTCVQIDTIDHNQSQGVTRVPLGTLWLDNDGIAAFIGVNDLKSGKRM